ncbi:YicC/YloC family endoribonuclease [Silicimonas algicola]|nr:YicC/YloC family endoribonuclease [Silicimonas algicola]
MGKTTGPHGRSLMSMTGFASVRGRERGWTWTADIRSVNGRGLELRIRVPDWVDGLEPEIRKLLQARLARGNVTVNLRLAREETVARTRLSPEGLTAALAMLADVRQAAERVGVELAPMSAADIAQMRGVVETSEGEAEDDIEALKSVLVASVAQCLDAFEGDRAREGAATAEVLSIQVGRVEALAADARGMAGEREALLRSGLEKALSRLLEQTEVPDEARMMQEMALIALKTDVTEELDRLAAHVAAARALLAEAGPVGRKFDFLMQEFNREANTLCSKSQSTPLTSIGLDLKAVIDQMREQVQNIE